MKISTKEQQRAEFLLQSQRIQLHQIESFSFTSNPQLSSSASFLRLNVLSSLN